MDSGDFTGFAHSAHRDHLVRSIVITAFGAS
jgi:hypothetical protein